LGERRDDYIQVAVQRMRILALVTDAYGNYGGIAQYNRDLFQALCSSPYVREIVVLPRTIERSGAALPKTLTQLKPKLGKLAYSLNALATARILGQFDLIYCGHLFHTPLAVAVGRMLRVPVWLQTHGVEAWECPSGLVRAVIGRTALVTAVSRYTRRRLLGWADLCPERVRVLPNTVRSNFVPGPKNEPVLAKYGLADKKVVLTVSRINHVDAYKGHARVIDAMTEVREAVSAATYVVVGDGDARAELEAHAERRGLSRTVRFLGRLDDDDVLALYRSADVFAMPSEKEGFGIVFVEAAATGLRVIGGNRDGSVDALADGVIGRIIDPGSQDEIVTALIDALQGPRSSDPDAVQRFSFPNFATHVDAIVRTFVH
jgi:phosphatidylinositol alpha-1,6-mannosyltransferase